MVEFLVISNFFSLKSRVVSVWGWLSLCAFGYRKSSRGGLPVRVGSGGLKRFGTSTAEDPGKICIGGALRRDQFIYEKGSRCGSSSAEDPVELLHRQTEEGRFGSSTAENPGEDLHWRRVTAGSTHRRDRIKEWIFIGRGSRRASTSTDGGRFGTSTSDDPGEDLHRRTTTAGSPHRRKGIQEWICISTRSMRSSTSSEKGR